MTRANVFKGSVDYQQILDEKGIIDKTQDLFKRHFKWSMERGVVPLDPKLKTDLLKRMYELMVFTRAYDDKAIKLQRQGRMGTYAPLLGEEAVGVGAALALQKQDWACPTYRNTQVYYIKGIPLHMIYLYWKGIEDGMNYPKGTNCFPFAVPIASHLPHAVGIAYALKRKKKKQVMLTFVGDGGTSEGDFHEALNFAGVWKLPIVFIIVNNQWAISVPRSKQTASKTLAQKGLAYGIPSVQVDGNDCLAVYTATKEAIDEARAGHGPKVIEAITYRMSMHTTADDPTKYRTEKDLKYWKARDPIDRFKKYLTKKKIWTNSYEKKLQEKISKEISSAVKKIEEYKPDPHEMFKYVWAEQTEDLKEQMKEMDRIYGLEDSS
jgi:pyruvate dehydrogenase E1 component alpha subunit